VVIGSGRVRRSTVCTYVSADACRKKRAGRCSLVPRLGVWGFLAFPGQTNHCSCLPPSAVGAASYYTTSRLITLLMLLLALN
jgi:hypothetical protein